MITKQCHIVYIVDERTTVNLLFLGETGAGKSTWINGFANYVSYETLAASEEAGGFFPISATFHNMNPATYDEQVITTDKRVFHGDHTAGHSVTQEPRTYSFTHGDLTINVIDTPGLSNTEDAKTGTHDNDMQHVDDVLHFIGRFDKLHAICILLKANQSRITAGFAYCITEILRNLHESACNNVIFIITNARSTYFKPGNTYSTLKNFLKENKLDRIKLNPDTIYCVENDIVQHIAEFINECPHEEDEHMMAEESWKRSAKATVDMLTYIQSLTPHEVDNMQCIYNTRRLIRILSKVLLDIFQCMVRNSELLESKKKEIEERQLEIKNSPSDFVTEDLRDALYTEIQKIEVKELKYSNTICKSLRCSEVVGDQRHFKRICCVRCRGFITLWTCRAFAGISGRSCKHCGCDRSEHEWTATKTELKTEVLFDKSTEAIGKILTRDDALRRLQDSFDEIEKYVTQNEKELEKMLEVGALLSIFLEKNVLGSSPSSDNLGYHLNKEHDAFECEAGKALRSKMEHVEHSRNANDKETSEVLGDVNRHILATIKHKESLSKLIQRYEDYYEKASRSGKVITMLAVYTMVDELYKLPQNGTTLKEAVTTVDRCQKLKIQDDKYKTTINIPIISKVWRILVSKFK